MGELFQKQAKAFSNKTGGDGWLHYVLITDFFKDPLNCTVHTFNKNYKLKDIASKEKLQACHVVEKSATPVDPKENL